MAKKNKNGLYLIILLVLVLVFLLNKYVINVEPDSNIDMNALKIDTSQVASIMVTKPKTKDPIHLLIENNLWIVKQGERKEPADEETIKSLFGTLQNLKIQSLAGTNDAKWEENKLTDSLAIDVQVFSKSGELLKDIYIGKFTYKPDESQRPQQNRNNGIGLTYMRLATNSNSYIVEGFLPMTFNQQFDHWRNQSVLKLDKNKIEEIQFNYPSDSSFVITKVATDKYLLNHADTLNISKVNPLLSTLTGYKERKFADGISLEEKSPLFELLISGQEMNQVNVSFYEHGAENFVVRSNQYPQSSFLVKKDQVFNKILKSKDTFFK